MAASVNPKTHDVAESLTDPAAAARRARRHAHAGRDPRRDPARARHAAVRLPRRGRRRGPHQHQPRRRPAPAGRARAARRGGARRAARRLPCRAFAALPRPPRAVRHRPRRRRARDRHRQGRDRARGRPRLVALQPGATEQEARAAAASSWPASRSSNEPLPGRGARAAGPRDRPARGAAARDPRGARRRAGTARAPMIVVDGTEIRFWTWGEGDDGPPLVLVHGGGAHTGWWEPVIPHLAPGPPDRVARPLRPRRQRPPRRVSDVDLGRRGRRGDRGHAAARRSSSATAWAAASRRRPPTGTPSWSRRS